MASVTLPTLAAQTLAELVEQLGGVPLDRIRLQPPPGTATERDLVAVREHEDRLCELADGVLVEKAMGFYESRLAAVLLGRLERFLSRHDLGIALGADGTARLAPGLVRIPDVSFFSWSHFPDRLLPKEPIPDLVPDFVVEVWSEGNTKGEMQRKRREYFAAGVRLLWEVDPKKQSVAVYTSPDNCRVTKGKQTLDGAEVLPGFKLSVQQWFALGGQRRTS